MLEEAIVDAEALREAALKNAEAAIIEKYSDQIKEAVESLLEQPEDEDPLGGPSPGLEDEGDVDDVPDLPMAGMEGEDACPCPDEDEDVDVVFDLDDLIKKAKEDDPEAGVMDDREDVAMDLEDDEMDMMQEIDISEDDLMDIFEKLTVDVGQNNVKSGWAGTPSSRIAEAEEELLAAQQDTDKQEELAAMRKAVRELEELKEEYNKTQKTNKKLHNIVNVLKEKAESLNLSNARLLYTNRILVNDSLNERQKLKIAENLSKAETVEEAKVIFETLQNAVGSTNKRQPKSLSEAVNRKPSSSSILPRRNSSNQDKADPVANRWKALAGIK
tara:strand:- start:1531 stop:2520 length:990 start_codon:yes stop_codon:yes gene_type:complete